MSNNRVKNLISIDIGTTTLAGRILNNDNELKAEYRSANPQQEFGGDVVKRLERAANGESRRLQQALIDGLNLVISELLDRSGLTASDIHAAAACGNSAICGLLLAQSVSRLLFPPHRPVDKLGRHIDPASLGLNLEVPLYLFPLVSGYVGGDLVAFVHVFEESPHGTFLLDIGTNGEMALKSGDGWLTTSVAAGPAFEGGDISCGMQALPGAITATEIVDERWHLTVVGRSNPVGLSGSGLVSAVGTALQAGLIDKKGSIASSDEVESNLSRYLIETSGGRAMRLYRDASNDVFLTQEDVRAFQLARAAIRAGALSLLDKAGMTSDDVRETIVTGAFGFSLSAELLKKVAMLPDAMLKKASFEPAGALRGVERYLLSAGDFDPLLLAHKLKPLPLSGTPIFEKLFLANIDFT